MKTSPPEHVYNPLGVRKIGAQKRGGFLFDILFYSPDFWFRVIQQQIRRSLVAIVRKADAPGVDDGHPRHLSNVGPMNMSMDNYSFAECPIKRL